MTVVGRLGRANLAVSMSPWFRALIVGVCGWEAIAIPSRGRLPTITICCSRHRRAIPVVLGLLAVHLVTFPVIGKEVACVANR